MHSGAATRMPPGEGVVRRRLMRSGFIVSFLMSCRAGPAIEILLHAASDFESCDNFAPMCIKCAQVGYVWSVVCMFSAAQQCAACALPVVAVLGAAAGACRHLGGSCGQFCSVVVECISRARLDFSWSAPRLLSIINDDSLCIIGSTCLGLSVV